MCKKFPIGTKLRAVEDSDYGPLVKGQVYTVTGHSLLNTLHGPAYLLAGFPKYSSGFFGYRFEATPVTVSDEPFNISTATDQELADEYRRLLDLREPIFDELTERGFKVVKKQGGMVSRFLKNHELDIVKSKTVVTKL